MAFVLGTVRLAALRFKSHRFNPREPSEQRVLELMDSVRRLSLLNPLVCAYLAPDERGADDDLVVLIDGRHRHEALVRLAQENPEWAARARVDVKVYLGLSRSQLLVLATYLNRNRAALKKGEYYQSVARIYDERARELARRGAPPTERAVFRDLHGRELANRDFDLSIGRLVGLAAFARQPQPSWWPLVGSHQNQLLGPESRMQGFAPLTAGNLAELLRPLCRDRPYDDTGASRRQELRNVLRLGTVFRRHCLAPLADRAASRTSVACKHWMVAAFGRILAASSLFPAAPAVAPLAGRFVDWGAVDLVVQHYGDVAEEQAAVVANYRATSRDEFLAKAWSHQTQRDQVAVPLLRELQRRVPPDRVAFRSP
ncbi:MAG: hypothetical protein QOD77_2096 [Thermoplasmata archaeon]|jgi:hypothetical protein|nr:hypothetical protein [Thermoplasmata archaeon]